MFTPNLAGVLRSMTGRDAYAQPVYGPARACRFGSVNMQIKSQKTSVRADSSASRGAADEIAGDRLRILFPANTLVKIADQFEFDGQLFLVATRHLRRSVLDGSVDHIECDLEVMP